MTAHVFHQLPVDIGICFFQRLQIRFLMPRGFQSTPVAGIQRHAVLDVDSETRVVFLDRFHIVADLALQADVRHQPDARFRIDTRHIARVGVTVRIAVLHIKENHKIVPIANHVSHCPCPPSSYTVSVADDNIQSGKCPDPAGSCAQDSSD